MDNYSGEEYNKCKVWVAGKIQEGYSWDDVVHFCDPDDEERIFDDLKYDMLIIPPDMEFSDWPHFIQTIRQNYTQITELYGVADGNSNQLPVPFDIASAWVRYKNYLLGKSTGKPRMSSSAVDMLENNCHWMLNHLERDTRLTGPVKGLVMGSVQSGKTANMIGLVTMAAHYDWNVFIILSGTIENLRRQTRDRFNFDLLNSGGVKWHVMDYTNNPDYMLDINDNYRYAISGLKLNTFQDGHSSGDWLHRYVFVCLKNSRRLTNLIQWLHSNASRSARMRILVIDDEADQASINTVKMNDPQDEEEIERTAVNKLIINLIKGNDNEGTPSANQFQAMNYISFTATPYANVLNEAYKESLYPSHFICSLPESKEYFGPKAIWGSKTDERYSGLNIVRIIPDKEIKKLKEIHKDQSFTLPDEFKKSVAWFLCAAAILRKKGYRKPISMLIHTTAIQRGHFSEYEILKGWLKAESKTGNIVALCETVYSVEKNAFRLSHLKEGFPEYSNMEEVDDDFPEFAQIKREIEILLSEIVSIHLGDDGALSWSENAIHLCVDNCKANRVAEEGEYLRIVYPNGEQLKMMSKAPVFIVMGGNTLSRGLTLEGLVCTYFARNVNQADTLMQMARWFGYRRGYELLQRIWMPKEVEKKFALIEEIDEKLKTEFEDFMEKGKSPSAFGPRIMSSSQIAKFLLTSKNKSQNMIACDVDFSGDSYETTQFDQDINVLKNNIFVTDSFLNGLCQASKSSAIDSAYVWYGVDSSHVISDFLEKYKILKSSYLYNDIPIFIEWMKKMNDDGNYLKWNVAIAGDKSSDTRWIISGADVGKIERSRKNLYEEYVDIGSLRSGRDVLCDINVDALSPGEKNKFDERKKSGKNLIGLRFELHLKDFPLLLLYKIDKDKGKKSNSRGPINTDEDIVGFSIVIAGQEVGTDYVKSVTVKIPE
jgi:hypothetical protein